MKDSAQDRQPTTSNLEAMMRVVQREARVLERRSRGLADLDELISAGGVGLAQALQCVPPEEAGFRTYARQRIRGAMLDYLRQMDPLGRAERKLARRVADVQQRLRSTLNREPDSSEIASEAGIELSEYEQLRESDERRHYVGLVHTLRPTESDSAQVFLARDGESSPEEATLHYLDQQLLARLTRLLDERQRYVIENHFFLQRSLHDIASDLRLSPSRVTQVLRKAIDDLKRLADLSG